jgi:hypothetical protein
MNTHIIQHHYLHVELNGTEADAWNLQHRLSGWCHDDLLPALEKVLNQFVPETEHWSIDRLDIDAGVLSLTRLEQDLATIVALALEKQLREQISSNPPPTVNADNIGYKTKQQNLTDTLVYFLTTGRLPWSTQLLEGKNLEQMLLDTSQNTATINIHLDGVLRALTSITARKRLVRQFSPLFMTSLLAQFSLEGKKVITAILAVLQNADLPATAVKQIEQQLWETLFAFIAMGIAVTENAVIAETWQALQQVKTPALETLLVRHWSAAITNTPSSKQKLLSTVPVIQASVKQPQPIDTHTAPQKEKALPSTNSATQSFQTIESEEGIYIDNAGLILLHPFLPQFFTALGIAAENQLIQAERALCLLHFLTTGLLIAPEYELTLAKILCNIPLEIPVESDIELSDVEIEEAEALLNAVIRHWDALQNTSIDGLRGEFLFRFGKLSMRNDGDCLLQVETKTVDILLNQLPWGISMIKLPWMHTLLWVEWNY